MEDDNPNNRDNVNDPNDQGMAHLVLEAAQYDWAQPTADNLATAINKGLFSGSYVEDPQRHLKNFLSICAMQRQHNMTPEAIRLLLFPFSKPTETLHETWERFKGLLVTCPHHGIPEQMLGQRFYMGLAHTLKANVDVSVGGAFFTKTFRESKILLNKMAQNSRWTTRNAPITPVVHSVALGPANSMGQMVPYQRQQGYNQQNQPQAYQQPPQQQIVRHKDGFAKLEGMMQQVIGSTGKLADRVDSHELVIKNMEIQLGQISMALNNRPHGTLPTDTQINPKDQGPKQLMVVSLRNGRDLDLEQEIARESRPTETLVPVPVELDNSARLTEVTVHQAHENTNKAEEVVKETEIDAVDVVLEEDDEALNIKDPLAACLMNLDKANGEELAKWVLALEVQGPDSTLPVIISASLLVVQAQQFLQEVELGYHEGPFPTAIHRSDAR
ncbi:PREDICTED: uncharacterized protein LOC109218220 [Nicotiana attenuata]|uniref:uncharacterized protein LOC109218220 n=1 Tax=Nicotiana attenuata TaxID=49451 RepID=UPI0009049860|nr:PREDICTED: uncharacterized protein LOC109218220 [Nicotiana attenuata]